MSLMDRHWDCLLINVISLKISIKQLQYYFDM